MKTEEPNYSQLSKVELEAEEKKLREELRKLPRKKWPSLRSIVVGLIFVFGSPYFPLRGGALIERQSYAEAVWPMGIVFLFLLPISYYWNIKQVNDDMMAIEHKLIRLKYRRKEIEEQHTQET